MKLDRNIDGNLGRGKYALLLLRNLKRLNERESWGGLPAGVREALDVLGKYGIIDWGTAGTESEFMLIRLKDKYAQPALRAYANAARADDPEFAAEVDEMAKRSGLDSPFCKRPD